MLLPPTREPLPAGSGGSKNSDFFGYFLITFSDLRVGSIFGRVGGRLGVPIGAPVLAGVVFGENSRF